MAIRIVRTAALAFAASLGIALVARVLMRLVAWDTYGTGEFTLSGTLGIALLFVVSGVGAALGGLLTSRGWVLVLVVLVTSGLLWWSDVVIGLSSFDDARSQPMTPLRWVGFWLLFAAISVLALLTPWVGVRLGSRVRRDRAGAPASA